MRVRLGEVSPAKSWRTRRVSVKVQPRASKEEVVCNSDKTLKVYLKEAPTDGKANKALVEILADYYGVAKADISIVSGLTSRKKIVEIASSAKNGK